MQKLNGVDNSRNKSYGFYIGGKTIDNQARKISDTFNNPETYTQIRNKAVADFAKSVANGIRIDNCIESKEYSQSREDGKRRYVRRKINIDDLTEVGDPVRIPKNSVKWENNI